jgi:hypothetical protein
VRRDVPVTVRPASGQDRAWAELAAELTPAKSLARVEAATARVVAAVTVVGVLLTGLGVVVAGLPTTSGAARVLAVVAVVAGSLAVVLALAAQVLTVTRGLNAGNLVEVRAWYRRRLAVRAPLAQAGTVLLVVAALAAGTAATIRVVGGDPDDPTIAVTRTSPPAASTAATPATGTDTVTVEVTFRGLHPGDVATVRITAGTRVLARAAFTPGPDGTAARTLSVDHVDAAATVTVQATAGSRACMGTISAGAARPELPCRVV